MPVSAVKLPKANEVFFPPGIGSLPREATRVQDATARWTHDTSGVELSLLLDPLPKVVIVGRRDGTVPVLFAEGIEPDQHPFQVKFVLLIVDLVHRPFEPQLFEFAGAVGVDQALPGHLALVGDPSPEGGIRLPAGGDTGVTLFSDEGLELLETKVPPFVLRAGKVALPFLSSLRRRVGHACRERILELPMGCPPR